MPHLLEKTVRYLNDEAECLLFSSFFGTFLKRSLTEIKLQYQNFEKREEQLSKLAVLSPP